MHDWFCNPSFSGLGYSVCSVGLFFAFRKLWFTRIDRPVQGLAILAPILICVFGLGWICGPCNWGHDQVSVFTNWALFPYMVLLAIYHLGPRIAEQIKSWH